MDLLNSKGVSFTEREFFDRPFTAAELKAILAGRPARELLDPRRPRYKELELDTKQLADDQLLEMMTEEPGVLKRPILTVGKGSLIGLDAPAWERALT